MKDIENTKKESPFLGLTGMGGGAGSLMWKSGAPLLKHTFWTWGSNEYGQLGQNSRVRYSSPIQVGAREDWARVQMGYGTALIRNDNTLWVWGRTNNGMLGLNVGQYAPNGNTLQLEAVSSPTQVGGDSDGWNYAAFGRGHGIFTKTDGTIWGCGGNGAGQLGLNTPGASGVYRWSSPVQLFGTSTKFKEPQITFPYTQGSLVIDDDSNLWAMGQNHYGQLGLNDAHNAMISSPTQIPGSWAFIMGSNEICSFGVKTDGTRWGWGRNWAGQLGDGSKTARSSPTQIPGTDWSSGGTAYHTIATTSSGTMYANGSGSGGALGLNSNTYHETPQQIPGTNWQFASVQTNRNLASRTDGSIWTWGAGSYGNLGLNENTSYSSPKQIPGTWDVADQWSGGQGYICGGAFKKV